MSTIQIERTDRLAILRLSKARGNAIDEALAEDLLRACVEVAADDAVRGVLLASAHPKVFCPGLDLVSLVEYDRAGMERFMGTFGEALWALYDLRKPVVAALSGHAVAGGCVLALAADYRVLRRGAQIGLNEVKIGIPLPWSVALLLQASVAPGSLARVALLGNTFTDEEALALGLVDLLSDAGTFEATCLARLAEFAERDTVAVGITKAYLRAETLRRMQAYEKERAGEFLDLWFSEPAREKVRQTVASLSGR